MKKASQFQNVFNCVRKNITQQGHKRTHKSSLGSFLILDNRKIMKVVNVNKDGSFESRSVGVDEPMGTVLPW